MINAKFTIHHSLRQAATRLHNLLFILDPMSFSPTLTVLANYLAGEFDNREQAIANPAWYVHLRLWQRPVSLFTEDSITLFAEQANILYLDRPYRPRLMRLQERQDAEAPLQVQYYIPKDLGAVRGAGANPELLKTFTPEQFELLSGCQLVVAHQQMGNDSRFNAKPPAQAKCSFTYEGNTIQVALGFEATQQELLSYDKGIDPATGAAKWGAIMGPYHFQKRQNYAVEW